MPAILFLLFLTVPAIAALSLDISTFVPLLILFCVVAGLSTTPAGEPVDLLQTDKSARDSKRAGKRIGGATKPDAAAGATFRQHPRDLRRCGC